jgi:hypothetical protein
MVPSGSRYVGTPRYVLFIIGIRYAYIKKKAKKIPPRLFFAGRALGGH